MSRQREFAARPRDTLLTMYKSDEFMRAKAKALAGGYTPILDKICQMERHTLNINESAEKFKTKLRSANIVFSPTTANSYTQLFAQQRP